MKEREREREEKNERTKRREKREQGVGGGLVEERQEADDASLRDGIPLSG